MKSVLIIGAGQFGIHIARRMAELRCEIMVVDSDEGRINSILPYVTNAQIGNSTNAEFMESLGIDDFDVCIVTISSSFQDSLETTALLKELGAKKVIARAQNDVQEKFLLRNGADEVVYPEGQLASWMVIRYCVDHVLDYIAVDSEHAIYDVTVPPEWHGKTVGALDIRKKYNLNLLAVRSAGRPNMTVTSDTLLEENQTVLVLGTWKDIQKCFKV